MAKSVFSWMPRKRFIILIFCLIIIIQSSASFTLTLLRRRHSALIRPLTSILNDMKNKENCGTSAKQQLSYATKDDEKSNNESISLENLSKCLVDSNIYTADDGNENGLFRACFVVAGGGGHALSTLASTPGASKLLLEGSILYDRESTLSYVGNNIDFDKEEIQYVSLDAAMSYSNAALDRAFRYVKNLSSYHKCIGVACTSSLVSNKVGSNGEIIQQQRSGRVSRGHIVTTMSNGNQLIYDIKLSEQKRTRTQEDILMSKLVLQGVLDEIQNTQSTTVKSKEKKQEQLSLLLNLDGKDDHITYDEIIKSNYKSHRNNKDDNVNLIHDNVDRIISNELPAVLLIPSSISADACANGNTEDDTFFVMPRPILPKCTLVLPGSFNPPHIGHVELANAAIKTMSRRRRKSQESITKTTTAVAATNFDDSYSVLFELSIINADKPPLDPVDVSKRAQAFFTLDSEKFPADWGIMLSSEPLFSGKVEKIRSQNNDNQEIVFVVGVDTFVRIINKKYYKNNDYDEMLYALREMKQQNVHFVVGGRLDQQKDRKSNSSPPEFFTGEEEKSTLPRDVQEMFTLIPEEDFRIDLSSTELRKKQQQHGSEKLN